MTKSKARRRQAQLSISPEILAMIDERAEACQESRSAYVIRRALEPERGAHNATLERVINDLESTVKEIARLTKSKKRRR